MTTINLYGKLAKKFGSKIKIHLGRLNDFVSAVDSVKNGFREELIKMHNEGLDYFYDYGKNEINVLPIFCGSGKALFLIIAIILIIMIVAAAAFMAAALASSGATLAGGGAVTTMSVLSGAAASATLAGGAAIGFGSSFLVGAIMFSFSAAVGMLVSGIQMMMQKTPDMQQQHAAAGGTVSSISDTTKSYVFNSLGNGATQGGAVPIGYGRYKIGSKIIGISVKNYSTNQNYTNEFQNSPIQIPNIYD